MKNNNSITKTLFVLYHLLLGLGKCVAQLRLLVLMTHVNLYFKSPATRNKYINSLVHLQSWQHSFPSVAALEALTLLYFIQCSNCNF